MRKFYLGAALAIAAFAIPSLATADVVGTLGADVRVTGDLDLLPTGGDRGDENGGGDTLLVGRNTGNIQNWTLLNFDLSNATAADVATGGSLVIDVVTGFNNANHGSADDSFSVHELFIGNTGFSEGTQNIGSATAVDGTVSFVQQGFNTNDWVDAAGTGASNFIGAFDSSVLNNNTVSGYAQGAGPATLNFDFDAATGQRWLNQGFADLVIEVNEGDALSTSRFALAQDSAVLTVTTVATSVPGVEPSRPNIILMMADDMGWGGIDAPGYSVRAGLAADGTEVRYQGTPNWETPNLAAMASNGLQFSRMYSQSPVCSPTRASVMTGRHPERIGIPFANNGNMENREITLAEYGQALGYKTGIFGKWHLGSMTRDVDDANRGGPGSFGVYSFPTNNGFDDVYATESKTNTYNPVTISPTTRYWTNPGVFVPLDAAELLGDDSAVISRENNAFMEQAVNDGEPFLSIVWFHTPHKPVTSPSAATNSLDAYIDSMEDLDAAVGEIRAKVQELGIADNTILMFTSDNGAEDGQDWNANVVPLRANKRELYEGGVRVPGMIEWPGTITPGETHTPMVTTDYLPTILEIWGIDAVDARPLDGQSMVNTIFNDREAEREKTMIFQSTNGHRSAVGFNGRYKLITTNSGGLWSLYDVVYDFDENDPIATSSNIDTQDQTTQDIYDSLLADFNSRTASIGSGLTTSFATDYESRIASATGITIQNEPPENLDIGDRPSNTPELFIERQYATLRESLTMNSDGSEGTYQIDDTASLAAGTVVHSYLVYHDPENNNSNVDFEITFEDKIVGVSGAGGLLTASHSLSFADPNFGPDWGLNPAGSWTISNDGYTISFSTQVTTGVDQARILTESSLQFTPEPSFLLGDVNQDGVVDFLDISPFIGLLSTGGFQLEADINQDGVVDFLDISPFIGLLAS